MESATGSIMQAQGLSTAIRAMGYYDMMLIGRTGMGKTTTMEKLLVANPDNFDYSGEYPTFTSPEIYEQKENKHMKQQDICMWCIPPGNEDTITKCSKRTKLLTHFRANFVDRPPHECINESRANISERTLRPELFSNERTKIRVLDVRGFFGTTPTGNENGDNRSSHPFTATALNANSAHLGTMRSILHIQASMSMNFRRILYFLPCRGTLESSDITLREELQLLHFFFGRSIFDTMIIVATLGPVFYKAIPKGFEVTFPPDELEKCKRTIQEELENLVPINTPQPPIMFISLKDTCETILEKVKTTPVVQDGLQLQLKSTVCARCSVTIGEKKGERVATTNQRKWSESEIYEHSHCHPLMVPKYSRLQKIVKGIAYVVKTVARREPEKPDFNAEQCINCGRGPGSLGCWNVFTKYVIDGEKYVVNHTNKVHECQMLIQEEDLNEPLDRETSPEAHSDDIPPSEAHSDFVPPPSFLRRDGTFKNTQSDALVLGVEQRKPTTNRIRNSVSLNSIPTDRPRPTPRPRTKLQNSTATLGNPPPPLTEVPRRKMALGNPPQAPPLTEIPRRKAIALGNPPSPILPVTQVPNSTATPEIMYADKPAVKSADTSSLYSEEFFNRSMTPSDDLNHESVYQQEVTVDLNSSSEQHDGRSWSEANSVSNDSSKKGT